MLVDGAYGLTSSAWEGISDLGVRSAASEIIGGVTREALEAAANGGGPTVKVVTRLTQSPASGRALSVWVEDSSASVMNAARSGGRVYTAEVPKALIDLMEQGGLVQVYYSHGLGRGN